MASGLVCLRCVIPKFASFVSRSPSLTIPILTRPSKCYFYRQRFCSSVPKAKKETVTVYYVNRDGSKLPAKAKVGDNLLDVVIENDIDIDGYGACEGTLACSTCHVILKKPDYDKLPEEPTDEELDMLDLAYGITDTSRLGCQIIVTKDMEGLEVMVPTEVADARG